MSGLDIYPQHTGSITFLLPFRIFFFSETFLCLFCQFRNLSKIFVIVLQLAFIMIFFFSTVHFTFTFFTQVFFYHVRAHFVSVQNLCLKTVLNFFLKTTWVNRVYPIISYGYQWYVRSKTTVLIGFLYFFYTISLLLLHGISKPLL